MFLLGLACSHPPKLVVDATYPSDGATDVPLDTRPTVTFNREIPPDRVLDIRLEDGRGALVAMECQPKKDKAKVICTPEGGLADGEDYLLSVDIFGDGTLDAEIAFSTGTAHGLAYDLADGLEVKRLGESEQAAALLQSAVEGSRGFLFVLDGFNPNQDDLPWDGNFLAGPGEVRPVEGERSQGQVDPETGLTIATRGSLEADGRFRSSAEQGTIMVEIDGDQIPIAVRDVDIRGNLDLNDFEVVNNVVITALLSAEDLEAQIEKYPEWASIFATIADLVDPDVDTDGDLRPDASSIKIVGSGPRIDLVDELPGGGR